ncbi:MAG: MarR family transcriptional regulator [Chloroflexi bacterium]|nr:MAG: MarR family transcriptional regulator [Chloroflexota bacterium]
MLQWLIIVRVTRTISESRTVGAELLDELGPFITGERAAFAQHCHVRAISMAHLYLISLLEQYGPLTMGRVAELLGSGLPTATGLVTRVEERGLVERIHDTDDRRLVRVRLTDAGLAELRELQAVRRQRLGAAIQQLTGAEQVALLASIRSLRSALSHLNAQGEPIS